MDVSTLYYIADPMCSWCWGFAPVIENVAGELPQEVHLQYVMGGLAKDSDDPMSDETQAYVKNAWREVTAATGARFDWKLLDREHSQHLFDESWASQSWQRGRGGSEHDF